MHILGDKVKSMRVRLSGYLGYGLVFNIGGRYRRRTTASRGGEDFFSLLVGGGVDKSPHFLTVTDSRPLELSLFFSLSLSLSHVYE